MAPVSVSIGEGCKDEESTDRVVEVEQTVERHQSQSGVPVLTHETKADGFSVDDTFRSCGPVGLIIRSVNTTHHKLCNTRRSG